VTDDRCDPPVTDRDRRIVMNGVEAIDRDDGRIFNDDRFLNRFLRHCCPAPVWQQLRNIATARNQTLRRAVAGRFSSDSVAGARPDRCFPA